MSTADLAVARQTIQGLCADLHLLRGVLEKKPRLTTLRDFWEKAKGKAAEVTRVVTPWLDPLAAARAYPYLAGEFTGSCAADAVLRLWKNEMLGAHAALVAAGEAGNPIWRRLEVVGLDDEIGAADAAQAEAEDDNGGGRLMAAWHFLRWLRHSQSFFRLSTVQAELDFEFARLGQSAIPSASGGVVDTPPEKNNGTPAINESQGDGPTGLKAFRLGGQIIHGLTPTEKRLLVCLWRNGEYGESLGAYLLAKWKWPFTAKRPKANLRKKGAGWPPSQGPEPKTGRGRSHISNQNRNRGQNLYPLARTHSVAGTAEGRK